MTFVNAPLTTLYQSNKASMEFDNTEVRGRSGPDMVGIGVGRPPPPVDGVPPKPEPKW